MGDNTLCGFVQSLVYLHKQEIDGTIRLPELFHVIN